LAHLTRRVTITAAMAARLPAERRPWTADHLDRLRAAVPIATRHMPGMVSLWLYGSARVPGPVGDVDLAVFVVPSTVLGTGELGAFAVEVAAALGSGAPELDLRVMRLRSADIAHEVRSSGELLWESDANERAWVEAHFENVWLDAQWLGELAARVRAEAKDAA
jgi:hypothetical protein